MKKIMMILVMAAIGMTASAQNTLRDNGSFTLQPKVGLGLASFSGSWEGGGDYKMKAGFVIGAEGEYYVNDWFSAALGLNYAQQGWKFEKNGATGTTKLDFINVPIVANFYIAKGLALRTGLQMGFLVNAKDEAGDAKDRCKSTSVAIPIGISGEYENFVFDARYNIAVSKINKYGDNSQRSDLVMFTIGYKFQL